MISKINLILNIGCTLNASYLSIPEICKHSSHIYKEYILETQLGNGQQQFGALAELISLQEHRQEDQFPRRLTWTSQGLETRNHPEFLNE